MVLTTTMVFAQTDGIELVLLNHTCTRGPSVTRMRDFSSLKYGTDLSPRFDTLKDLSTWLGE